MIFEAFKLIKNRFQTRTTELISRYKEDCKEWDERGNNAEEGIEILEELLSEAKQVMETANNKHEQIKRRMAVIEEELERAVDKAEECELRGVHYFRFFPTVDKNGHPK